MRYGQQSQISFNMAWTPAVRFLIIINVVIFLLQGLFGVERFLAFHFGLIPRLIAMKGWVWQLGTYMFLHHGLWHIFFNMFALWMFGSTLERVWGTKGFLKYYFLTGLGGGLCYFLFNLGSTIPTIGASGAIYGLLVAYAVLFPNNVIYLWLIIPIKAKWFALLFGVIEFMASLQSSDSVAHLAHLGGMVIGYLYLKKERFFGRFLTKMRAQKLEFEARTRRKKEESMNDIRNEVDELLDKINRVGYDGLTPAEQKKLKRASEILRKKNGH